MNLSKKLVEFTKTADPKATVDDFFDHCEIPQDQRTDFVWAAILNGTRKIEKEEEFWDKIREHNDATG